VRYLNNFPNKIVFKSIRESLDSRVFDFNFSSQYYNEVLFDHYAIESSAYFKKMLWEMNRFDAP
jgi:hypothetical protein